MAASYPAEQFPNLNLPGFNSIATLSDITSTPTDWQTTLSLSIFSLRPGGSGEIDVLTAIRTEDTETHPDVISTPTGRFPQHFQAPLLASRKTALQHHNTTSPSHAHMNGLSLRPGHFKLNQVGVKDYQVIATFAPNLVEIPNREDPLAFLAQEALARKLGLGDALQKTKLSKAIGTISLCEIIAGFSYAAHDEENDTPLWEPLLMYAAAIMLTDRGIVPKTTKAYREISWTGIDRFLEGKRTKTSELLIPGINPDDEVKVCLRGLCLDSTENVTGMSNLTGHIGQTRSRTKPYMIYRGSL